MAVSTAAVAQSGRVAVAPAMRPPQVDSVSQAPSSHSVVQTAFAGLPDSPGTVSQQSSNSTRNEAPPQPETAQSSSTQSSSAQDSKSQHPVGTAAAEAPVVSGVTAAQPSGVAIAPAKQRRARTVVIRVGAVLAAGAAVGAVVALTAGTSSKPPGAH